MHYPRTSHIAVKKWKLAVPVLHTVQVIYFGLFFGIGSFQFAGCRHPSSPGLIEVPVDQCPDDSTSHEIVWQFEFLGEGYSSLLHDVAIVNDSCVWVVGDLYLRDTTGALDPILYNAALWNGQTWSYKRILIESQGSAPGLSPIWAVFTFGPNDVWFGTDASLIQWNGSEYLFKAFFVDSTPYNYQIRKLWGTSGNDMYCVGRNGGVFHVTGTGWKRLNNVSSVPIEDIWGTSIGGQNQILAIASNTNKVPQALSLLQIEGETVSQLPTDGLPLALSSVWFADCSGYWLTGDGVYRSQSHLGPWTIENGHPFLYKFRTRGLAANDVFIAGTNGMVSHFNGKSWHHYSEAEGTSVFSGNYYSIAVTRSLVCAVGQDGPSRKAVVILGHR